MKPPSVWDKSFRYTPSDKTDIRLTFERIRQELKEKLEKQVTPIKRQA